MTPYDKQRRRILKGMLAVPIASSVWGDSRHHKVPVTREFDVSRFTHALVPRGHGEMIRLERPYTARYPSRAQCMQFMAFFGESGGLYIQTHDPVGHLTSWDISRNRRLTITFYGPETDVTVNEIPRSWQYAAERYRDWALEQAWARRKKASIAPDINVICMAASRNLEHMRRHVPEFVSYFDPPRACWISQWRKHPFDVNYPDYSPSDVTEFRRLLAEIRANDTVPLPYVNGLLVDDRVEYFKALLPDLIVTRSGALMSYSPKLSHLKYACPSTVRWQRMLHNVRNGLVEANGSLSGGIYLDLMAAVAPRLCFSSTHAHEPGDPLTWTRAIREILRATPGLVMVEGNAEVYIDCTDIFLMHSGTEKPDIVPLWNAVYGSVANSAGWRILPGTPAEIRQSIERASSFGTGFFGSPWMEADSEIVLLREPGRKTLKTLQESVRPSAPTDVSTRT